VGYQKEATRLGISGLMSKSKRVDNSGWVVGSGGLRKEKMKNKKQI